MSDVTILQALQIAVAHHQAGRFAEAEAIYRQVLAREPFNAIAIQFLGTIAFQTGHIPQGMALLRRAIALKPDYADAYNNLGRVLVQIGQLPEAIDCCKRAIALNPRFADAHNNLGIALENAGEFDPAIESFRRAVDLSPTHVHALTNLGSALTIRGRNDEAIDFYNRALKADPNDSNALLNLGNTLKAQGRLDEAIEFFRSALKVRPNSTMVHSNLIYTMHFDSNYAAPSIREEQRRWNDRRARPLPRLQPHAHDRDPDRRLRIGYVSADFRDHIVGRNLLPLFREHDHNQFEVFCYSGLYRADAFTEQFQARADHWRSIFGQTDLQIAQQVREDRIDILVDLTLHMSGSRLLVFARQPAPIQATFAGYPGSTGLETIQYRLTDPYLEPPGGDDHFWSEAPMRLPNSFWCYDDTSADDPPVSPLPALSAGHITFGSLNNFCKVNTQVLQLWAEVMNALPTSRLILLTPGGSARQRTIEALKKLGITADRIEFVAHSLRNPYLALYRKIDIGLETFPYNGHSTSLDAYWMGVPVPTLVGEMPVSRAGFCHLMNLGLPELIAHDKPAFVKIVTDLANDWPRLAELRSTLRERLRESPLMDAGGFARSIEFAYRMMWRTYCAS